MRHFSNGVKRLYFEMDGEEEEEGSVKVFLAFMKAAHRAIEVIGDASSTKTPSFKRTPSGRGRKGELASATTVASHRLFFVRFCNFLLCGQNDNGVMPGCFFQLLKDAELEQRRINLSSVKHAKFMRALQEESEIVVTFRIMDQLKKLFILASDFCGEMIKFMYLVWDDPEKLDELENAWFSNESIVSFLHRTTVASFFFHFHGQRLQVSSVLYINVLFHISMYFAGA